MDPYGFKDLPGRFRDIRAAVFLEVFAGGGSISDSIKLGLELIEFLDDLGPLIIGRGPIALEDCFKSCLVRIVG